MEVSRLESAESVDFEGEIFFGGGGGVGESDFEVSPFQGLAVMTLEGMAGAP